MEDINIGAISEALNNKVDLPTPSTPQDAVDYVVAMQRPTADNNYTWYRKYKSGWVEQGRYAAQYTSSTTIVSLPVAMQNNLYVVLVSGSSNTTYANLETTGFSLLTVSNAYCSWQVSGMAA